MIIGVDYRLGFHNYLRNMTQADLQKEKNRVDQLDASRNGDSDWVSKTQNHLKFLGWYKGRMVNEIYQCFGDVCPDNGGYFVVYADKISAEECKNMGDKPIWGISWGPVYGGCEPQ